MKKFLSSMAAEVNESEKENTKTLVSLEDYR